MARPRASMESNSSGSSSPERVLEDDDNDSVMLHGNESQSSLSVSLEEMEIDNINFEEQQRLSPICRLPAELLINVFAKLGSSHDILSCMLVCKVWARNSVDLLWHRPSTNRLDNLTNVSSTAQKQDSFFAYHSLIKRLNLGQIKENIDDGVLLPLAVCKRIERLTLPGCSKLTDASLVPIIDGNRNLSAIDVSELELITDLTVKTVARNCFRLQGLNVSSCKGITDESLVEVARNCRRLKRLKLNDCFQLTDLSVFAFADHCHDILEIDLFRCTNITDEAVTALIKEGKQLRELRLAQCFRVTDEAFLQLPTEHTYEALRILDLTDCNELQDAGLMKIVQAAPRLRNLVLAKCRNITDRGVSAITKLGKNLHFLHLGHCANITDVGVTQLVRHCNRIRYIDFSCCSRLTDDSVALLANLPKLKRIGLVKCNNVTDLSIQALARPKPSSTGTCYHLNNLERLHLSYCTHLTINGIRTLLMNCLQLTHLSLTGVPPFLREEILRFCRQAPQEFNDHQRDVFCVFSGQKVNDLRNYLRETFATPPLSAAGLHDDDPPESNFAGPASAPDATRPFGVNRFNHPFDWAAPTPPGLWTPQHQQHQQQQQQQQQHYQQHLPHHNHQHMLQHPHQQGPPATVRLFPFHNFQAQHPINASAHQNPAITGTPTPPFTQSAPSGNPTFMPPPLFAPRSHSPGQGNGQPTLFAPPPGLPGPSRVQFTHVNQDGTPGFAFLTPPQNSQNHRQYMPTSTHAQQAQSAPTFSAGSSSAREASNTPRSPRTPRRGSPVGFSSPPGVDDEQGGVNL